MRVDVGGWLLFVLFRLLCFGVVLSGYDPFNFLLDALSLTKTTISNVTAQ